ncbi:aspartyl protease family protein 2 [Magnolia sinica]|uniref:aspartyl protease family protein 2 n=1 Tax=Magnolia sinica TaxID=86752 RepID=UPI0026588510|nr:aspartyl protease family protein 2 [Magnolia sinica]
MKGTQTKTLFPFFLCLTFLSGGFSKPLDFQTLVLTPLSKPPTPNLDLPWSHSEASTLTTATETTPQNTLHLRLEHVDSLASNSTPDQLFHLRLQRDALRVKALTTLAEQPHHRGSARNTTAHVKDFSSSVISGLPQGSGEYFTRLGVGTPPKYSYMVLDTGSDIVWLQCAPCRKCYSQTDPVFDPSKSRSFSTVACGSPLCRRLDVSGCGRQKSCLYQVSYGDGSFTVGEFSTETLTFRGTTVGRVALGCGHDNEGLFVGAAGLLGLGKGKLSFPSQTGRQFGRKFSYCLVDRTSSAAAKPSSVIFGESAVPRSAIFTPMLANPRLDTFYYVGLTGISVGGARVRGITASSFRLDAAGNGGVIVDSGTSVTRLVRPAYEALRNAFRARAVGLKPAAGFSLFDTCYNLAGLNVVKVPTLVLHFGRGSDVSLPAANYLIPVSTDGIFCFAFAGTTSGLSIIGNIQQQGFRVVFDAAASRVGFAPHGCA